MIKTTFKFTVICDNCKKEKTYIKDNKEAFVIDLIKDGYFIITNKTKGIRHYCTIQCKEGINDKTSG